MEEGGIKALQNALLKQGHKKFGPPSEAAERTLRGIVDLDRLDRMSERLLDVSSWQELLGTP